ncbi:HNH_endonuclease [Hexamita inflata]|uniref:HNH endonuclease n=1 Tax=Hexamita inflata TaxID=28002 RepID=A0AA86PUX3_9EUKA|nr:HNH endonuclease [Hexamita inflata]
MSDNEELTNYESFDEETQESENTQTDCEFQIKTIEGFPRYSINTAGEIFDIKKNKEIKQRINNGYYKIDLFDQNNKRFTKNVHRILAETFIPNPLGLPVVNHKNRVRTDNRLENLEWTTISENCRNCEDDGEYFDELPDKSNCCEFQFYNNHAFGHYFINTKTLEIYYDTDFQFRKLRITIIQNNLYYNLRNTEFKQIKVSIIKLKKGLYN